MEITIGGLNVETVFNELYEKLYATELRVFAGNTCGRNAAAKAREIIETETELQKLLSAQGCAVFETYNRLQYELSEIEKADVFTAAFSLGLRIGAGVFGKTASTPFAVE